MVGYYLTAILRIVATPEWLIGVLVPVVTWFIVYALLLLLFFKPLILQGFSKDQEFRPVDADEFPQLDINSLQRYTDALESAGFVKLIDFKIVGQISFARLFVHPQHSCWAEVNQIFFKSRKPMPIAVTIMSAIEPNWSLSTMDRKISGSGLLFGVHYMWRHPRTLWINQPGVTPSKLLQTHLQRLGKIVSTLNLQVTELTDTSLAAYSTFQREERIKRKKTIQHKNIIVGVVEALFFAVNPKQEWMGEYEDVVATKMRSSR